MDKSEKVDIFNNYRKKAKIGRGLPVLTLTEDEYKVGNQLQFFKVTEKELEKAKNSDDLFVKEDKTALGRIMMFLDPSNGFLEDNFGSIAGEVANES